MANFVLVLGNNMLNYKVQDPFFLTLELCLHRERADNSYYIQCKVNGGIMIHSD